MPLERLDKIVSSVCEVSRKDARTFIKKGRVSIDGTVMKDPAAHIDTDNCKISFDGEEKIYKKYIYVMLNKPAGILSASNDKTRETVVDLVKSRFDRDGLFPVGRLDKDTTGLLIVTDDGDYGHKVISPKSNIEKEYIAEVDKPISEDDIAILEQGVTLIDGTVCRPAKVKIISDDRKQISIVITEGKYHEIKRMLGVVGAGVNKLHRERIGGLKLDSSLSTGDFREITPEEMSYVWK